MYDLSFFFYFKMYLYFLKSLLIYLEAFLAAFLCDFQTETGSLAFYVFYHCFFFFLILLVICLIKVL